MQEIPTVVVAEVPQVFILIRGEVTVGYLFDLPSGAVAILDRSGEILRSDSLEDFARFFGRRLELSIAKVRQDDLQPAVGGPDAVDGGGRAG
ncbi:hypothetical protein [Micromonospora sp. NPDC005197]|uniref:hypothetical protein n=1 Tax=Micromonospora sp. NPDC005197 TaxID=3157020 RepID=UPI0033A91A50